MEYGIGMNPALPEPSPPATRLSQTGALSSWPRFAEGPGNETDASVAEARRLIEAERAPSTLLRYAGDWRMFVAWMGERYANYDCLPAPAAVIGLYIGFLRTRRLAKQTILGRLAAIQYAHELAGLASPLKDALLRREIRGLRRQQERPRQAREALLREDASRSLGASAATESTAATHELRDVRDRAIVSLAWCSALRRSNIAVMRFEDVRFRTDDIDGTRYLEIFVPKSKTDQEAVGRHVVVTELPGDDPLCAYRALRSWLDASGISQGPLFRSFSLHRDPQKRQLTARAIGGRDVARAVKRIVALGGLDPSKFAAHSTRRGFVTSADQAGVRRSLIREQGGWKDDRMISTYTRLENVRDNALREMFKRKEQ